MKMIKSPLPRWYELLQELQDQLGPNRKPLLIGIDGADGLGKSSLASWLAWQLGMPTVHLDFYLVHGSEPMAWMAKEIDRIIGQRTDGERPMIIEGTYLLDVLEQIEWQPDLLVYVRGEGNLPYTDYVARHNPEARAHFCLDGLDEDFRGKSRSAS